MSNVYSYIVKQRINIDINKENTYSPISTLFSKRLNFLDFGFKKSALKKIKEEIKPNNC